MDREGNIHSSMIVMIIIINIALVTSIIFSVIYVIGEKDDGEIFKGNISPITGQIVSYRTSTSHTRYGAVSDIEYHSIIRIDNKVEFEEYYGTSRLPVVGDSIQCYYNQDTQYLFTASDYEQYLKIQKDTEWHLGVTLLLFLIEAAIAVYFILRIKQIRRNNRAAFNRNFDKMGH